MRYNLFVLKGSFCSVNSIKPYPMLLTPHAPARPVPARSRRPGRTRATPRSEEPPPQDSRRLLLSFAATVALGLTLRELLPDLGLVQAPEDEVYATLPVPAPGQALATFAGGCFWCMERPFDEVPGVLATTSGYTGGRVVRPSYLDVCTGRTGHAEAVQVLYDPERCSYDDLLAAFWRAIDPTQADGQFVDHGPQYRSAIFTHSPEQAAAAAASKAALQASGVFGSKPLVTAVEPAAVFYPAEEYHQLYWSKYEKASAAGKSQMNAGYCQFVVAPKVQKFRQKYAHLLKKS
jgi:methionine-S-sulfoxide reductase